MEPALQDRIWAQLGGFVSQNDKDGLGDLLRMCRDPHLPQRDRIDQIDMSPHQLSKGVFIPVLAVILQ